MITPQTAYQKLVTELREIALLGSVSGVVGWDERVMLPPNGAKWRAEQSSLLARLIHERMTARQIGHWLDAIEGSQLVDDRSADAAVNVREARRSYERARKLPPDLVEELARTEVLGQHAWADARAKADYKLFEPTLAKILAYKRRQAECYGYRDNPYDALLEDFEPGETAANIARVFEGLRGPLVDLVGRIESSGRKAPAQILHRHYPKAAQEQLARMAATAIGFDFQGGRLDVSLHPFSSGIAPGDTRITTRYEEHCFGDAFFGTLHECGHAMYSQGLPEEHFGTPCGEDISLGIHESQSRLWENLVGRGRAFWRYFLPKARALFPEALAGVSEDDWYRAVNDVRPSLIRTEADEATYNLHILIRFELEQAMLRGELSTRDVPAAWNERMKKYLGVVPPDDSKGCLQDIHWSAGALGYFPTYTLGNLYAAQFFEQAKRDLPGLEAGFEKGEFAPLLVWLRKNIHSQGKRYRASELVRRVTGRPLEATALLGHLNRKAAEVYGI